MQKIALLLLFAVTINTTLSSQNLVSATLLGQKTKAELLAEFDNLPFIQYGAKYYQITYTTKSVQGLVDTASGLLSVPDDPSRIYPRLVYQHGTSGSKQEVPSINVVTGGEGIVGQLFAGLGYVAFLPDYLGLGNFSKGFHPYVHAESEAWVAMDMLRASVEFLQQNQVLTNDQLFITGYSQGGHGAMALHRAIEQDPTQEFQVTAAAPMSGPYSISGVMRDLILTDAVYFYPAYIPNTALSYQTVYGNLFNDLSEIFKPTYAALIQQFYEGQITLSSLNSQLITTLTDNEGASRPFKMLQESIIQDILANPDHPINVALNANDTYDGNWLPVAPFRLFYCMEDDQVPYRNSLLARDSFQVAGVTNFAINDVMPTADHGECYVPAMTNTLIFFLGYQQIGTVGTNNPIKARHLNLSPNPAREMINISDLPSEGRLEMVDFNGKLMHTQRLSAGSHSLNISDIPNGVYLVRFFAKGEIWMEKLVVQR
ncbi:MAG: T9SS type A sorting domain-containing protein [Saprospiraceae bacterium]|nr:T9SS type A sorting domain-containing protein [Saprospiraceae bacterium]